jgi:hypothetical protein
MKARVARAKNYNGTQIYAEKTDKDKIYGTRMNTDTHG